MKQRLIELLKSTPKIDFPFGSRAQGRQYQTLSNIADHLLANSVFAPPCKVGDDVFAVLYDPSAPEKWHISKEHVTEVGTRGVFISSFSPPEDDLGIFIPWQEFGTEFFLTRKDAEKALAERSGK